MIYVFNPQNKPKTNTSIMAEPIDALEIYTIVKTKYEVEFLDLDLNENLPIFNNNDIFIFIYDYIIPLHTENVIDTMKTFLKSNNHKHSILISKQCFQYYDTFFDIGFDFLIYTNPEYTINKLLNCIENNDLESIENTFYYDNNILIKTKMNKEKIEYIIPERNIDFIKYNDVRTIISSIGCNNKCKFCPTPYFQGNWNGRSANSIFKEVKYLTKLGFNKIMFLDDNFTESKERIYDLCRLLNNNKIKCNFGCLSSINNYNYELFKTMYDTGFKWVHFGIESADDNILKTMNKKQTSNEILNVLKQVKSIGFKLRISLIIDYPGTTSESINKTLKLIKKIKPNEIRLHYTAYRPLTPLYNKYKINNNQYIHNNNVSNEQIEIKNKYVKYLEELNYTIIDEQNFNWNNNNDEFVASFVPIKYGRNW